ncbi:UDP-N-acetylmuramoyl-L-alanyl-D-glutamate--2,6-diaminopimelate ligase [Aciditerrimonas ferrireducens]|jgi:UDP-N-acetylmuramoyl-L-alanyl-D-glutamate--2,6-diaminopimelate ligase|uniref:UDP-N-acetylmuramoyl-L-alanyl-D-glutamate--2, 6-diaminopimelate ligase n=1 Tax=Aciditerrimonas ferrireducens TaxID=667306 RepID=UPI002006AECB|nr:UDP-N-acetylmuramoyl-L-alanyl-D-glutamate--2,6-diaminopimelate ligase [Aciditerrimonas ferrireducens]MCK4176836.1 UDP-N-acetylmuramoyl-L-alanyl-D-glutamate--2,6-diaminopimelate ligase [Aciditerrimonas ferrireducens]
MSGTTAPARWLRELAAAVPGSRLLGDGLVRGVAEDSREVQPGWLFVARRGTRADGHRFVADALERGAAAVALERPPATPLRVPVVLVPNTAAALGPLAACFHGWPANRLALVGVTGTNGKTTTAELVRACLAEGGHQVGLIGTISVRIGDESQPARLTTPGPVELQATLRAMAERGVTAVAMEVSSHALDQFRVDGTRFALALFTNLDSEHLDYHGTMEQYWAAKARLFEPVRCEQGVVCVDDPWGQRLAAQAQVPVLTVGQRPDAAVRYRVEDRLLAGSTVHLEGRLGQVVIPTRMIGTVNGANVALAYVAARLLGVPDASARAALAACPRPPGRFELVDLGQPFLVVVDYAHTPDALASLVATARRLAGPEGQVRVVVGARGGRDRFKRPQTGKVAASAGWVVLTTDSPGEEDPLSIIEQLRIGTWEVPDAEVFVEPDRRAAIALALGKAQAGDVVLIVGRGHEGIQHVGREALPLDDREEARQALAALGYGPAPAGSAGRRRGGAW